MTEQKVLVVGLGEVGQAIFDLLKESGRFAVYGCDLDESRMRKTGQTSPPSKVDVIHVCIPCKKQEEFVSAVIDYAKRFKPKLVIINSTVPPGTTKSVSQRCTCLVAPLSIPRSARKPRAHEMGTKALDKVRRRC